MRSYSWIAVPSSSTRYTQPCRKLEALNAEPCFKTNLLITSWNAQVCSKTNNEWTHPTSLCKKHRSTEPIPHITRCISAKEAVSLITFLFGLRPTDIHLCVHLPFSIYLSWATSRMDEETRAEHNIGGMSCVETWRAGQYSNLTQDQTTKCVRRCLG